MELKHIKSKEEIMKTKSQMGKTSRKKGMLGSVWAQVLERSSGFVVTIPFYVLVFI